MTIFLFFFLTYCRGAAEWIIRNGGKVKFASSVSLATNFTSLPFGKSPLVEIHAKDVAITNSGLSHLGKNYILLFIKVHNKYVG